MTEQYTLEKLVGKPIKIKVYDDDSNNYISVKCNPDIVKTVSNMSIKEVVDFVLEKYERNPLNDNTARNIKEKLNRYSLSIEYGIYGEVVKSEDGNKPINNKLYIRPSTDNENELECKIRISASTYALSFGLWYGPENWCQGITTSKRKRLDVMANFYKKKGDWSNPLNPTQVEIENLENGETFYHVINDKEIVDFSIGEENKDFQIHHRAALFLVPGNYKITVTNEGYKPFSRMVSITDKSEIAGIGVSLEKENDRM